MDTDQGPVNPPIFLLGEAQGENEARINAGFVGASGIELLRMLNEAGVITLTSTDSDYLSAFWRTGDPLQIDMIWRLHPEVHRSNVFQLHPPGNKIETLCGPRAEGIPGYPALIKAKYVRKEFSRELDRLAAELDRVNPNLVLCLGNSALWALCGTTGITKVRGTTSLSTHTISGFKCLATYHPAAVIRQWELRPVTVADLIKARGEAQFPEIRRVEREIWIEPDLADIERFFNVLGTEVSVDIETAGTRVTCIGFAPTPHLAIVIPFDDKRRAGGNYWPDARTENAAWGLIRGVLENRGIKKTFQNGLYDIAFLWRAYGIKVFGAENDTMLLHHALQPESLKGLGFLGSVYANESAWKTERKTTTIKRDE